jgi:hypothetical protein
VIAVGEAIIAGGRWERGRLVQEGGECPPLPLPQAAVPGVLRLLAAHQLPAQLGGRAVVAGGQLRLDVAVDIIG